MKAGVVLAVNVGVNFKSKLDTLLNFKSQGLSGASLPTIIQSIEAELQNQKKHVATISVSALQNGGTQKVYKISLLTHKQVVLCFIAQNQFKTVNQLSIV